jgi:ABC-type multidrug transport system fused ATPase/permease subunit
MSEIQPGIHPHFEISNFEVPQQRALRRLSQVTHLTRDGKVSLGGGTTYHYALIRPVGQMRGLLHTDREVMVVFSDFPEFQSRTLDTFDRILNEIPDEFRIEKVARLLVSADPNVSNKVKKLFESKPDAPVVVPFYIDELSLSTPDHAIASRIREFTFSRDLFSMSSPLRGDLYFYGRSNLINEISSKLASGENFGLFGLRRSGKTSIVHGINRAVPVRSGASVIIDCQSPTIHQRRWFELLEHIVKATKEGVYPLDIRK